VNRALRAFSVAVVLAASAPTAADELGPLFLASLPASAPTDLPLDGPIVARLALHPGGEAKVASAREWFRDAAFAEGVLVMRLDHASPSTAPTAGQRAASFLVDVDDPAVAALRDEIAKRSGAQPALEDLTRFVDGWITKKDMSRVLDNASTVAVRREGDCTEHAVLTAAVARLFGKPSRVVMGIALVRIQGRVMALGHAWAEIHEGGQWRIADAAARSIPVPLRYLPLAAVADEGPGFDGALWQLLTPVDVKNVVLTGAPPQAPR
jgi:transglutaminase-like putative cysteine protease